MNEFGEFLGKFSFRVAKHAGLVMVAKKMYHSPTLRLGAIWMGPAIFFGLVMMEVGWPQSSFGVAQKLVVRFPYLVSGHLGLAVEAATYGDYHLAEREYWLTKTGEANMRVLGFGFGEIEKKVFPREWLQREIGEIEATTKKFPGHRDLLLYLTLKYWQIDDLGRARELWEEAFSLDPNNTEVVRVGKLIKE